MLLLGRRSKSGGSREPGAGDAPGSSPQTHHASRHLGTVGKLTAYMPSSCHSFYDARTRVIFTALEGPLTPPSATRSPRGRGPPASASAARRVRAGAHRDQRTVALAPRGRAALPQRVGAGAPG